MPILDRYILKTSRSGFSIPFSASSQFVLSPVLARRSSHIRGTRISYSEGAGFESIFFPEDRSSAQSAKADRQNAAKTISKGMVAA
jgi:hypothetical protein